MYKIMILLVILGSMSFLFAQEPVSMRNVSLGNVIDGDWENLYDPIELNFYPQQFFFTNLSDYAQQVHVYDDSLQFLQKSEFLSEYPFGFTFRDPFLASAKHAFLIRFKDNQMPNLNDGSGESESISTSYYDSDSDYIYDIKQVTVTRNSNYRDMNARLLLLLNSTMPLGDNFIGIRFTLDRNNEKWNTSSMSVNTDGFGYLSDVYIGENTTYQSYSSYDMINFIETINYYQNGKFKTTSCTNEFSTLLSFMHPTDWLVDNSELRYDLNISLNNVAENKTKDTYDGEYHRISEFVSTIDGTFHQDYTVEKSSPRNEVFANAKFRHNLDEKDIRLKKSFWEFNVGMGGFGGDYNYINSTKINYEKTIRDTTSVDYLIFDTYQSVSEKISEGSYMGFHAKLMGKSSVYLSDYVCFGYGLTFDLQTFDRKNDYDYYVYSTSYHQEGTAFDMVNDYRNTSRQLYSYKQELTQTNLQTILPVGLEFSMPQSSLTENDAFGLRNFVFRLGTVFTQDVIYMDYRNVVDGVDVNLTTYETGDGNVTESHPTYNSYTDRKNVTKQSSGSKRYTAGIGYNHSDNLSIDLGSYLDSNGDDFFVGLMFTVKR